MTPPAAAGALERRGRAAALAFVVLGIALRAAVAFPVHKYPADADCLNSGLVALRIEEGHFPAWYTPRRIGSLECYAHAAAFRVLGPTRAALAVAPLVSGALALALYAALALSLLGPVAGPLAILLFALPPPAYVFWTYMPNAYPETLLLCVAVLWAADAARLHPAQAWRVALFGFLAGLGLWNSIQTLSATLPAAVWLAAREERALRSVRSFALAASGFVLGALPFLAWNVLVPLGSFEHNFSVRPASGLGALAENARYLFTYALPELVASVDPENGINPASPIALGLRIPVLVIWSAAALFALWRALSALAKSMRERRSEFSADMPLVLVGLTVCALAVISGAGGMRGLTVRYVLPAFLLLPAALALAAAAAARAGRAAAVLAAGAVCAVLAFNVSAYFLPGTAPRRLWEAKRQADEKLIAFLGERRIDVVFGDYWSAYPVNFLSGKRIRAVPIQQGADFYEFEKDLTRGPARSAVVARTRGELERFSRRASASGTVTEVGLECFVLVPEGAPDARALLRRLREASAESGP